MRLYNHSSQRLYLSTSERRRFLDCAHQQPLAVRSLALTLVYTGVRLSEARELSSESLQIAEQLISVRSLKKRNQHHIREIPILPELVITLQALMAQQTAGLLWPINRITAYRWIKRVMDEANIRGAQACPKGLRHGFGVHAVASGVPLNMVQRWMGHTDIKTTAIYTNAVGLEERELAQRMWQ